jgi:glyoxylase-like metal-dependent hydrolase (beta-lactamase superfamily II)
MPPFPPGRPEPTAVIADQIFRSLKLGFTRCYLIKCAGGLLLVDTSYPKYLDSFQRQLAKLGRKVAEIKYLLLTHHHDDHAGFAAELIKHTGCRVIVHRNAIAPLEHGPSEDGIHPVNRRVKFAFSVYALFHREFTFPPVRIGENDVVLSDDDHDFLKTIGVEGKILYTPGHWRDCLSVVLSDGSAFVGDAAMSFLRWTGIAHRPIYVEDIKAVYESWQKLLEAGARVIYPAHGKPFSAQELVPRHM